MSRAFPHIRPIMSLHLCINHMNCRFSLTSVGIVALNVRSPCRVGLSLTAAVLLSNKTVAIKDIRTLAQNARETGDAMAVKTTPVSE